MRTVFGVREAERLARLRDALDPLLDIGTNQLAMVSIAISVHAAAFGKRVWDNFLRLRGEADELIYDEIRRATAKTSTPDRRSDILSILLQARDEEGAPLTDVELRDELMTLLVAGHETTATARSPGHVRPPCCINPPTSSPACRRKSRPGRATRYLDAVIKGLRIRPVVPGSCGSSQAAGASRLRDPGRHAHRFSNT